MSTLLLQLHASKTTCPSTNANFNGSMVLQYSGCVLVSGVVQMYTCVQLVCITKLKSTIIEKSISEKSKRCSIAGLGVHAIVKLILVPCSLIVGYLVVGI